MKRARSRNRERLKPRPRPGSDIIVIDKTRAAVSQLETAISLWFRRGDPVSIHALASAAHDCLNAMSSAIGQPSQWDTYLRKQREDFQARALYFQNFIKHGFKDLKGEVQYGVQHGEALMFFAIDCYKKKFSSLTPLMCVFIVRFLVENPDLRTFAGETKLAHLLLRNANQLKRESFLDKFLPLYEAQLSISGNRATSLNDLQDIPTLV